LYLSSKAIQEEKTMTTNDIKSLSAVNWWIENVYETSDATTAQTIVDTLKEVETPNNTVFKEVMLVLHKRFGDAPLAYDAARGIRDDYYGVE